MGVRLKERGVVAKRDRRSREAIIWRRDSEDLCRGHMGAKGRRPRGGMDFRNGSEMT